MRFVKRALDAFAWLLEHVVALAFAALFAITVLNIVLRNVAGVAWLWIPAVSRLLFIWIVFLGIAAALRRNEHLVVDYFQRRMPPRLRKAVITGDPPGITPLLRDALRLRSRPRQGPDAHPLRHLADPHRLGLPGRARRRGHPDRLHARTPRHHHLGAPIVMNPSPLDQYADALRSAFAEIEAQRSAIEAAAEVLARAVADDQLIHVIGPGGHSNMAAEEVLWRAGGLAPVNPILDAGTNLIHGAKRSNYVERTPGYARQVLDAYRVGLQPGEVIVIVNAYGINAMTIDTVLEARRRGMTSVAITSRGFADQLAADHPSRHPSGKNLHQEADHFLDCCVPYGDAVVEIEGAPQRTRNVSAMTTPAPHWAIIDGHRVPHEGATVHVSDLGLRRGFAVFEMFRVEAGVPLFLEHHLVRLERSAVRHRPPAPPRPGRRLGRRARARRGQRTRRQRGADPPDRRPLE
jgi:uncharacterized phosphosugar-binding protein